MWPEIVTKGLAGPAISPKKNAATTRATSIAQATSGSVARPLKRLAMTAM
jgi:hypothetical protein